MFNLGNNDLLSSLKEKMDKEQKELEKKEPKKKVVLKEKNLKKEDFNELKEHFLSADEDIYDEEFERFKGQNERDVKPIRVTQEPEKVLLEEPIKAKKGKLTRIDGDDFDKYFRD